jgi:hypothetical protein
MSCRISQYGLLTKEIIMTNIFHSSARENPAFVGAFFALFFVASFGFGAQGAHAATINNQMAIGSTGIDVRQLQTLLATSNSLYPAGIVSGYYGRLTANAVAQFQIAYNLPPVGNVGPRTLAKLDQLMANGVTVLDVNAPFITNARSTVNGTSATISWNTSSMAFGKVHFDVVPVIMNESLVSMREPETSGTVSTEAGENISHSLTFNSLNHGQTYYYSIESADETGNLSVILPSAFLVQ